MRRILSIMFLTLLLVSMFNIQRAKAETGTIYIRADGSVEPSTAPIRRDGDVYTFTDNIYDSIVVERDNIIIDGAGYTLQGAGGGRGIDLTRRTKVTIRNTQVKNFQYGIYLDSSSNNTLSGNNIENNGIGVWLYFSSNNVISGNNIENNGIGVYLRSSSNNVISGNNIANNYYGILLGFSSNNVISGNNITGNNRYGIWLDTSSSNVIRGNTFTDCGLFVQNSYGNVVEDNTVNGKPLVYLEGVADYVVGDAGQVILVNCSNIRVENLNLSRASVGVQLWRTRNSIISGNNITGNNRYGIWLEHSSNSVISGNNIANNYYGILLGFSSNNVISGNNITGNNYYGIWLEHSSNSVISGNNIANKHGGIELIYSNNSKFYHNNFIDNYVQAGGYGSTNVWDDGYPSGGNYWSDYNGTDADGDGIGDTPYVINEGNIDHYPLMKPILQAEFGSPEYPVCIDGNCVFLKEGSLITAQPDATALGGLIMKRFEGYLDPSGRNLGRSVVVDGPLSLSTAYREEVNLPLLAITLMIVLVSSFLLIRKLKIRKGAGTEVKKPEKTETEEETDRRG